MNFKKLTLALAIIAGISACSDSNNDDLTTNPDNDGNTDNEQIVIDPTAYLVSPGKEVFTHNAMDDTYRLYVGVTPQAGVENREITVDGAAVLTWLEQNHSGVSIRNEQGDFYKPGSFSILDVVAYAFAEQKEDICRSMGLAASCDADISYEWHEERRAFSISVDGEQYDYGYWYDSGNFGGQDQYDSLEAGGFQRAAELLARDKMLIGFYPTDDTTVFSSRNDAQQTEIQRLNDNNGVVIIPQIKIQKEWRTDPNNTYVTWYVKDQAAYGASSETVEYTPDIAMAEKDDNRRPKEVTGYLLEDGSFKYCGLEGNMCPDFTMDETIVDLEVHPHNLRSDIYYPNVITMADVVLSFNELEGHSASMIYWPTLQTGAQVESFAFDNIDGLSASGLFGWLFDWGESKYLHPYYGSPHIMPDMAVMGSPELLKFRYANFYSSYYDAQQYVAGDDNDPYRDTRENVLTPINAPANHMKVADCASCHGKNGQVTQATIHEEHSFWGSSCDSCHTNAPGAKVLEPAKCAECHGNFVAPQGHNQKAGCLRCHSDMVNHGDVNAKRNADGEFESGNYFAHPWQKTKIGQDDSAVKSATQDDIGVSYLPDPYACVSCHQNPQDVMVGSGLDK